MEYSNKKMLCKNLGFYKRLMNGLIAGGLFLCLLIYSCPTWAVDIYTSAKHQGTYPEYPEINYGAGPKAELIEEGEYLVKAGDCIACHTAPDGKPFAGGLPLTTPFGAIYSTNITPDRETGIGTWTDQEFIRAMREGVAPDGSNFFPVFPYTYFNKMTDDDILAIRAYLDAIPAVHQANREPKMVWPFRWRFLQDFWKLLFFDFEKGRFKPNPTKSEEWNRGAYLVEGLGHCGMCHTPKNFLGAPKEKFALTGSFIEGFYAPNISAAICEPLSLQTIVNVFLADRLLKGGSVQGPMLEVNHDSLVYLDQEDLDAIASYLRTVKSKQPAKIKRSKKISLKVGEQIYNKYCVGCHTSGAGGAPKLGDQAAWEPLAKLGLNKLYENAIVGIGGMPPKGTCAECSTAEIQSAVDYIINQSVTGQIGRKPQAQPSLPQPTLATGKKIYDQVCSICHADGKLGAPKVGDQRVWEPLVKQNMDVLFHRALTGYRGMPPRGACYKCTDAEVIAAVKYMVQQSIPGADYKLW
ncbi:MAG: c-type cytochrome [Gammaproteobacteria bacterium]